MSTYASQADMVKRFGDAELVQATAHADVETTTIVEDVLASALADADAEINSYLGGRYSLPLAEVPRVLVPVACDLARYRLWPVQTSEAVETRYKAALKFLLDVQAGRASLGIASPQTTQATAMGGVHLAQPSTRFSRAKLTDW